MPFSQHQNLLPLPNRESIEMISININHQRQSKQPIKQSPKCVRCNDALISLINPNNHYHNADILCRNWLYPEFPYACTDSSAISFQLQNSYIVQPDDCQPPAIIKISRTEKSLQQVELQAAKNIISISSKLEAQRLKSAMVQKSDSEKRKKEKTVAAK